MKQYFLQLSYRDGQGEPARRQVYRETDSEATETARRWLRLAARTTPPGMQPYDRWTVSITDPALGVRILETGTE